MKSVIISKEVHGAPSEFQLLPLGRIDLEGCGPAILDDQSMDNIIEDFERRGNDMVIDYEHQTLKDIQAPAAGWIRKLLKRGQEGLWVVVEWTEKARQYLAKREYRYFSPVMLTRLSDHKIVKLVNVALTNSPKINHLKSIVAKMDFEEIDPLQRKINKMMGISDEQFLQYSCKDYDFKSPLISDTQREINKMMGISDEQFLQYSYKTT